MDAQLRLEWLADGSGLDEASQSSVEDGILRPGGQPDSQPSGGEVIDGAPPAVSCSDAFLNQPLVSGRVWKWSALLLLGRLPTRRNPPVLAL
jgi:hypothetical protein